ncbi:MAG TPA: hypothetical protein PKH07_03770 [bacterium]|nr:hypothetical protein [bacterium]
MMTIPKDLEERWRQVVAKSFNDDQEAALREALLRFITEEEKRIPKSGQFDSVLSKVQHRQSNLDDILADGLSDALDRMKKRKERGLPL